MLVAYNASSPLAGNIGVAPLPGSQVVYDRVSQQMVDCDQTTCPLARAGGEVTYEYFTQLEDPPPSTLVPLSQAPPLNASSFALAGVEREVGDQLTRSSEVCLTMVLPTLDIGQSCYALA